MSEKYTSMGNKNIKYPDPEELSALVDGELANDVEALLEGVSCDESCRAAWQRFHLVRDVIQKDYRSALPLNFAANVSKQIAGEDNYSAVAVGSDADDSNIVSLLPENAKKSRRRKNSNGDGGARRQWLPVAGLGLAASVAAAGFMAWQLTRNNSSLQNDPVSVVSTENQSSDNPVLVAANETDQPMILAGTSVPTAYKNAVGTRWQVSTATPRNRQVENRLNSLLLNHLEDSAMGRVQGMMAHSRVVAYDSVPVNESF